ncbi:1212_t:CDS:2 [Ambispora leptoticha]|uniref:1212_t:CDS:1 n=1 Tax=Ambispora leptoticha TaxID=144679 RepID=A0A9N9GDW4_9GLOM|nr:1212_t:CDS:2 [Ambispora leptoticha]
MVNIIEKQQQENKELLNEIELLKQQLADKSRELNDYKNTEVNEQEAEFKQKATERIHQILIHDYNWKEKKNLEEVVERIVIDHFESTKSEIRMKELKN